MGQAWPLPAQSWLAGASPTAQLETGGDLSPFRTRCHRASPAPIRHTGDGQQLGVEKQLGWRPRAELMGQAQIKSGWAGKRR